MDNYRKVRKALIEELNSGGSAQTAPHIVNKLDAVYDDFAKEIDAMDAKTLKRLLEHSGSGLMQDSHPFV